MISTAHKYLPGMYRLAMLLGLLLLCGCSSTYTSVMDEEVFTNKRPMSSYSTLIVREFSLDKELYRADPLARPGERDKIYEQIPNQLADQIKRYLVSKNIFQSVVRDGPVNSNTLTLKGRFTRVGRFRISLEAMLMDGGTGQEVGFFRYTLWEVFDAADSVGELGRLLADYMEKVHYR